MDLDKVANELFDNVENEEEEKVAETPIEKDVVEKKTPIEKDVVEKKTPIDETIAKLKKTIEDNKRWGHDTSQTYTLAKKRLKDIVTRLKEDDTIYETEAEELLNVFKKDLTVDQLDTVDTDSGENDYETIISKLNSESENYKKYNKSKTIDRDLEGFYASFNHLSQNEKKDLKEYLLSAESIDALERAASLGGEYNEYVDDGVKKHGNFIKYVKHLKSKNIELAEKLQESSKKLDNSYGKMENSTVNSRASYSKNETKGVQNTDEKAFSELFG